MMDHHELAPDPGRSISFSVLLHPLQGDRQSVGEKPGIGDELRLDQEFHLRTRTLRRECQLQDGRCFLEPTDHPEGPAGSERAGSLVRRFERG